MVKKTLKKKKDACGTCKFFLRVPDGSSVCLRFPPSVMLVPTAPNELNVKSFFPFVGEDRWCGEFVTKFPT